MRKLSVVLGVLVVLAALAIPVGADIPAPGGPFNTHILVQNLASSPAHCAVGFYTASGVAAAYVGLPEIPVGESAGVYVPGVAGLADGQYAAVVFCDQEVASVANFSDPDSGASYGGASEEQLAATLYAPGLYDNYWNYYSDVVVQNAISATATITLEVYSAGSSSPVYTDTRTDVPPNGFVNFEQEGVAELANNQTYSGKISSTGDAAAAVSIYGRGPVDNQLYAYNPLAGGSDVAYAPVIMDNFYGYNTALTIQNMGASDAEVTITYGTGVTKTTTIAPGAADARYTPADGLGSGVLTSAKVECTNGQPIAVLVNESTDKNRAASYTGFAAGTKTVRAPAVMRRFYKWNTSVTCQNVGTAPATMSIQYGGVAGTTTSPLIAVNGTHLFYQPGEAVLSDGWMGSATITSAEPIACVVNEDMNEPPERDQIMDQLYAYNGIGQ